MRVLVGCEESGKVREAFNKLGHDAYSCDLLPSRVPSNKHFQMDIVNCILSKGHWDIIILHPECTKLAVSGNRWYGAGTERHNERLAAIQWTHDLFHLAIQYASVGVALENPVGVLGKPTQYIQPWMFGHGETKKTGLWLHNLPELVPTNIVDGREQKVWRMPPSKNRKRDRSETYQGIADAMSAQWGNLIKGEG